MLKTYYRLTKPGIIYGNIMTTVAAFLFASQWHFGIGLLLATVIGIGLIIGSGCVFNNYIDRGIDGKMTRTKRRALVAGDISVRGAIMFGTVLGLLGFLILALYTNWLTFGIGLVGIFFYVVVYGIAKRRSVYGTLVGSISGSMPLVAGYTAISGRLDGAALLLFLIMSVWQLPHFYAIAIYRFQDYKSAGLPVWPVKKGILSTKRQIVGLIALFVAATGLLTILGDAGIIFLVVMTSVGLYWLRLGIKGFTQADDAKWARKMFGFSLVVLLVFSAVLSVGSLLI